MIQWGVGQLSTTSRSWVMVVFPESIVLFFGKTKHSNIDIFQNFGLVQNKSIIYRPGMYNLQTRTVTLSRSGKIARKSRWWLDLGFL